MHLVLAFGERSSPTIVKSSEGDPLRATGRFRVDATSGRIERCDLRVALDVAGLFLKRTPVAGADEMTVTFVLDAGVDLWVPSRMTDSFERGTGRDGVRVTGEATYSNYRRFRTGGRLVTPSR